MLQAKLTAFLSPLSNNSLRKQCFLVRRPLSVNMYISRDVIICVAYILSEWISIKLGTDTQYVSGL